VPDVASARQEFEGRIRLAKEVAMSIEVRVFPAGDEEFEARVEAAVATLDEKSRHVGGIVAQAVTEQLRDAYPRIAAVMRHPLADFNGRGMLYVYRDGDLLVAPPTVRRSEVA
jgi:hypothetical protein